MPKIIDQPKETIIRVAKEILEQSGYEELSIRAIAKQCGVSVGTIYNYFEDKKALDMYLMSSFWSEYENEVQRIFESNELDLYEKLRAVEREMGRFINSFRSVFAEVFQSRNYSYSPRERDVKQQMVRRIALNIEMAILKENPALAEQAPNASDIAHWILASMMMIHQMQNMTYEQLEAFIRKMVK